MGVNKTTPATLHLAISTGPSDGATIAALRLADRAIARGSRVSVYAFGEGARVAAEGSATADHVRALLRTGVHGGLLSWVVDRQALSTCAARNQVPGVIEGDGGDLWHFVRDADVSLGVSR
ncbi:MAG: ATP:corrinoid adenosyltransferase [Glaciecola sp.]